jgi:hypothetical protein
VAIGACSPCFYGSVDALRAAQRQAIEDTQLTNTLLEHRKREKVLDDTNLALQLNSVATQKSPDNILVISVDPVSSIRSLREVPSSTVGGIINITV